MKTLLLFFTLTTNSFFKSTAQKQSYQFIYYVHQKENVFTYYFSDVFTTTDWYQNKAEIIGLFEQQLRQQGIKPKAYTIKTGINGAPTNNIYQAIGQIGEIVKRDKKQFEYQQRNIPLGLRKSFSSTTKTLFLERML